MLLAHARVGDRRDRCVSRSPLRSAFVGRCVQGMAESLPVSLPSCSMGLSRADPAASSARDFPRGAIR